MGLTHIKVNIANPAKPRQALETQFPGGLGSRVLRCSGGFASQTPHQTALQAHLHHGGWLRNHSQDRRCIVSAEWPSGRCSGHFWQKAGQHPPRFHLSRGRRNDARSHEARTPPAAHAPGLANSLSLMSFQFTPQPQNRHSERSRPTFFFPSRSCEMVGLRSEESLFVPRNPLPQKRRRRSPVPALSLTRE